MRKLLLTLSLLFLPAFAAAQPAEQTDDQSKLAPGVSRGVAFMCVNSSDAIDANDFGAVRCGSTRQLMVEAIQSGTWNVGTVTSITNAVAVTGTFWQATQPVSGTVTANAGTNLDTSALLTTTAHDAAFGTAGAADAQVRTVQGIAGGTAVPVSGTFWQATQPVSGTVTVTDGAGALNTIVDSGTLIATQATGTNLHTVVDSGSVTVSATNLDVQIGGSDSLTIGTFPDNEPFNVAQVGGAAVVAGPCEREVPLYLQVSQTTGTQLVAGTASERIYICSVAIVTATAQNIALVDGTGTVCATSPTGLLGGSTAATGQNFAANGGWVLPFNPGAWAKTSTDADNLCLLQSSTGQISGIVTYVSVPNI